MAEQIALGIALALGLGAAIWDMRFRRIPNPLVLAMAAAAIAASALVGGWDIMGSALLHAAIALVVGMALFAARAIGAGDAKFYAAAALAVPLDRALVMLTGLVVSALVLFALMMVANRGLKVVRDGRRQSWTLPYAVPIFCGFAYQAAPALGLHL